MIIRLQFDPNLFSLLLIHVVNDNVGTYEIKLEMQICVQGIDFIMEFESIVAIKNFIQFGFAIKIVNVIHRNLSSHTFIVKYD